MSQLCSSIIVDGSHPPPDVPYDGDLSAVNALDGLLFRRPFGQGGAAALLAEAVTVGVGMELPTLPTAAPPSLFEWCRERLQRPPVYDPAIAKAERLAAELRTRKIPNPEWAAVPQESRAVYGTADRLKVPSFPIVNEDRTKKASGEESHTSRAASVSRWSILPVRGGVGIPIYDELNSEMLLATFKDGRRRLVMFCFRAHESYDPQRIAEAIGAIKIERADRETVLKPLGITGNIHPFSVEVARSRWPNGEPEWGPEGAPAEVSDIKLSEVEYVFDEGLFYATDGIGMVATDASDPYWGLMVRPPDLVDGFHRNGLAVRVIAGTESRSSSVIMGQVNGAFRPIFVSEGDSTVVGRLFCEMVEAEVASRVAATYLSGETRKGLRCELDSLEKAAKAEAKNIVVHKPPCAVVQVPVADQGEESVWVRLRTFPRLLPAGDLSNLEIREARSRRVGLSMRMCDPTLCQEVTDYDEKLLLAGIQEQLVVMETRGLDQVLALPGELVSPEVRTHLEELRTRLRTPLGIVFGHDRDAFSQGRFGRVCEVVNEYLRTFGYGGGLEYLSIVDSSMRAIERVVREAADLQRAQRPPPAPDTPVEVRVLVIGSENLYDDNNVYKKRLEELRTRIEGEGINFRVELPTPDERELLGLVMMNLKPGGSNHEAFNKLKDILVYRQRMEVHAWAVLTTDLLPTDLSRLKPFQVYNDQRTTRAEDPMPPLLFCDGARQLVKDAADRLLGYLHQDELSGELRQWQDLVAQEIEAYKKAHGPGHGHGPGKRKSPPAPGGAGTALLDQGEKRPGPGRTAPPEPRTPYDTEVREDV